MAWLTWLNSRWAPTPRRTSWICQCNMQSLCCTWCIISLQRLWPWHCYFLPELSPCKTLWSRTSSHWSKFLIFIVITIVLILFSTGMASFIQNYRFQHLDYMSSLDTMAALAHVHHLALKGLQSLMFQVYIKSTSTTADAILSIHLMSAFSSYGDNGFRLPPPTHRLFFHSTVSIHSMRVPFKGKETFTTSITCLFEKPTMQTLYLLLWVSIFTFFATNFTKLLQHRFPEMHCIFRNMMAWKRAGRGQNPSGIDGTAPGELTVECPACPHPGRNLPENWENAGPLL